MGEPTRFNKGDKAPNDAVYIEVGETGRNVMDPHQVELRAGEAFPENSNQNRHWVKKERKQSYEQHAGRTRT